MNFKSLENKYALTFLGLVLSVLYIIYTEFVKTSKPDLTWKIESNSNVFQLNNSIDSIKVEYKGEDLLKKSEKLKLLTINIKNSGDIDILENMYSSKHFYGFKLLNSRILSIPEVIYKSRNYIQDSLNLIDTSGIIILPKTMLDVDDEYTVKVLYLTNSDTLSIEPVGKISGILQPKILNYSEVVENKKHIPCFYYVVGFIFLILIVSFISDIPKNCRKFSRDRLLKKFDTKFPNNNLPSRIKQVFKEEGKEHVVGLLELLSDQSKFDVAVKAQDIIMKSYQNIKDYDPKLKVSYQSQFCEGWFNNNLQKLLKKDKAEICETSEGNFLDKVYTNNLKQEVIQSVNDFKNYLEFI